MSETGFSAKKAAIDDNGRFVTYADLRAASESVSSAVEEGRHLAFIFSKNTLGSLLSYVACLGSSRVVPLMLDACLERSSALDLMNHYAPRYVFAPLGHWASDRYADHELLTLRDFALYDLNECDLPLNSDLALLLTTSGSTGASKLVRLSYENVKSNAESIAEYLEITEDERPITSLPMNYSYGLSIINSHLLKGATLLMTEASVMQSGFWDFFDEAQATSIGGVPYTYQMLERLRFRSKPHPSLSTMTQAGGKISNVLQEKFAQYAKEAGKRFFVMYGQTEATARMSYLPHERCLDKAGSIGVAIPRGRFEIVDDAGSIVEGSGIEGELIYYGPNVSLGYAVCRDDLSLGDCNEGRLSTGDMAYRDADGFFYITGRKKRFLKIFGNRVSLDQCEQWISGEYGVECACSGKDDHLVVFVTDESAVQKVKKGLAGKIRTHISAITVVPIDEIPRNDSGKIQYGELLRR